MTRRDYFPTNPRRSGQSHRFLIDCPVCGWMLPAAMHADAKTSPAVMYENNRRATATVANAFGLPAGPPVDGGSCASTTQACASCYAASLEGAYPSLARIMMDNLDSVRHVAKHGTNALSNWLDELVYRSVKQQHAVGVKQPTFRWHSDGDLGALVGTGMDRRIYPRAIRRTARTFPNVHMWIYTRELWALPYITGAPNLRVLVSVDQYNMTAACKAAERYDLPVAVLANDPEHAQALWLEISKAHPKIARPIACPATGKWKHDNRGPAHIVGPDGRRSTLTRGETAVGACTACQACMPHRPTRSITFHLHNPGNRLPAAINTRKRLTLTPT